MRLPVRGGKNELSNRIPRCCVLKFNDSATRQNYRIPSCLCILGPVASPLRTSNAQCAIMMSNHIRIASPAPPTARFLMLRQDAEVMPYHQVLGQMTRCSSTYHRETYPHAYANLRHTSCVRGASNGSAEFVTNRRTEADRVDLPGSASGGTRAPKLVSLKQGTEEDGALPSRREHRRISSRFLMQ